MKLIMSTSPLAGIFFDLVVGRFSTSQAFTVFGSSLDTGMLMYD
jgi:hypothetical protein